MVGLGGTDFYYINNSGDVVAETTGNGSDRIFASTSYALGAGVHIELLTTNNNAATTAIHLTGNELANTIYGNAGGNNLDGKGGNDLLVGLAGADLNLSSLSYTATTVYTIDEFAIGIPSGA